MGYLTGSQATRSTYGHGFYMATGDCNYVECLSLKCTPVAMKPVKTLKHIFWYILKTDKTKELQTGCTQFQLCYDKTDVGKKLGGSPNERKWNHNLSKSRQISQVSYLHQHHWPFHHFRWTLIHANDVTLLSDGVEENILPELDLVPKWRPFLLWKYMEKAQHRQRWLKLFKAL